MRKTFLLTALALLMPNMRAAAEDMIQVAPLTTQAGVTENDEQYMEVQMVNDTYDEVGVLSFDLLLPEGIHFLYEDFEGDRVPFTKKGKNISYDFTLFEPTPQESGFTRYLLVPGGELRPITGKSGTFMYLYFTTDENMEPGIYPILMEQTVIGKSEVEGLYPAASASYIVIGDNPLKTGNDIDMSGLRGYIPSFVVEAINANIASNTSLEYIDLTGAEGLGADIVMPNETAKIVVKEGSPLADLPYAVTSRYGGTTDITTPHNRQYADGPAFDLSGRKITSQQKGVHIQGDRKMIVK